jgi:hypothetical protein
MRGAAAKTIAAGPFVAAQPTLSIAAGQSASLDLTFAPVSSAANQTFAFSCAQLPVGAKCSFSPQTAVALSSGTLPVQVTVSTTGATASIMPLIFRSTMRLALWLMFPGMVLFGGVSRRKRFAGPLICLIVGLMLMIACGGSSSNNNNNNSQGGSGQTPSPPNPSSLTTPAGTYFIVIQATSNNLVSSTVVSLSVQ